MSKKIILIVIGSLNRGGTEGHVAQVFSQIDKNRYTIVIYTTSHKGIWASFLEKNGVRVIEPPVTTQLIKHKFLGKSLLYVFSLIKLSYVMLRLRPSIVHCFLPGAYLMGGICAVGTRCQKLVMSRRSLNNYQKKHRLLTRIERYLYRKTDLIIGNSQAVNQQLLAEGVRKEKIALIYNGIDVEKFDLKNNFSLLRQNLEIKSGSFVMIIVANLFAYKGHADLFHALDLIQSDLPSDWILLCVGKDMGIGKELKALADDLNLLSHIQWIGECSDVLPLLSLAHLGILCSHEEGFSNSILEYMAMGLPMIVTDVGGNSEAVHHGIHGFLVPPKDFMTLGAGILSIAKNPELRKKMGLLAKQRVMNDFSLSRCIQQYEMTYAALLKEDALCAE